MMLANGVELIVEDKPDYNGILFEGTEGRIFVDVAVSRQAIEENRQQVLTERIMSL